MKPAIAIAALLTTATAVQASTNCMSAAELEASLVDWYGEAPVEGSAYGNTVIWASEHSGTWSLVRYMGDGNSCVIDTGTDWNGAVAGQDVVARAD